MGLARLDEGRSELQLCQLIDTSHAYRFVVSELLSDAPDVVILLDSSHRDAQVAIQAVADAAQMHECAVRRAGRSFFDDTAGLDAIQKYCTADAATQESICALNYLAVGCAGELHGSA